MSVGARRGDFEIIRDILRNILEIPGIRAAQLRQSIRTSGTLFRRYLTFLEQRNLIREQGRGTRLIAFEVTAKGRQVLELVDRLFEIMEGDL